MYNLVPIEWGQSLVHEHIIRSKEIIQVSPTLLQTLPRPSPGAPHAGQEPHLLPQEPRQSRNLHLGSTPTRKSSELGPPRCSSEFLLHFFIFFVLGPTFIPQPLISNHRHRSHLLRRRRNWVLYIYSYRREERSRWISAWWLPFPAAERDSWILLVSINHVH